MKKDFFSKFVNVRASCPNFIKFHVVLTKLQMTDKPKPQSESNNCKDCKQNSVISKLQNNLNKYFQNFTLDTKFLVT